MKIHGNDKLVLVLSEGYAADLKRKALMLVQKMFLQESNASGDLTTWGGSNS